MRYLTLFHMKRQSSSFTVFQLHSLGYENSFLPFFYIYTLKLLYFMKMVTKSYAKKGLNITLTVWSVELPFICHSELLTVVPSS
jgi:hypothetical protein